MSYKDKLSKMNARYKDSEQQAKAMFGEIDPGVYMAKLANAEVVESKSSGKLQVKRLHVVVEGFPDIVQQPCAACHLHIEPQFGCNETGKDRHFNRMLEYILSVARPVIEPSE